MKKYMMVFLISILIVLIVWNMVDSVEEPMNIHNSTVESAYTETDWENKTQENADGDYTEIDITVSTIESSVSVIMKTEVIPLIDENGITYYTLSSTYPIISIEGNESAAEKINADIRSRIDPFLSESESYEIHKNWAAYLHETEPERTDTLFNEDWTYIAAAGTLEDVLYSDDRWCLSSSGLVFLSNPYALGPFASGLIEFTIPYSDLEDMGFNEAYTYTGRLIVKLLNREIYSVDLNGDGEEETAAYYCEFLSSDETDTYENRVHLIADGFVRRLA